MRRSQINVDEIADRKFSSHQRTVNDIGGSVRRVVVCEALLSTNERPDESLETTAVYQLCQKLSFGEMTQSV